MFDRKQEGTLAGTHEGKPGLPRGRSRLPAPTVQASQRERILRSVVAAIADKGYPDVTVADIVRRAKVSRAAFYLHFRSREDCFFAATRRGGQRLYGRVIEAARAVPDDAPDEEALRTGCRAYLCFLADEPAFARVFFIDMPAAGPAAVERLVAKCRNGKFIGFRDNTAFVGILSTQLWQREFAAAGADATIESAVA